MALLADLTDLTTSVQEGQRYNYLGDFVNMLITLLFVIGLIFLTVWFLKKIMRSRMAHLNRSTGIKVLERRALNQKSSLYLVDILGKGVVISESQAGIHLVCELPPDTNVELMLNEIMEEPKPSFKETFAEKLKKLLAKSNG